MDTPSFVEAFEAVAVRLSLSLALATSGNPYPNKPSQRGGRQPNHAYLPSTTFE